MFSKIKICILIYIWFWEEYITVNPNACFAPKKYSKINTLPIIYLFNTFSITRMSKFKVKIPMFGKLGPWTTLNIHMQLKSFDHKFPLIKYLWNQYVSSALSVHVVLKQTFWYIYIHVYINNAFFRGIGRYNSIYLYISYV